jgi:HPr kinase/phosphorylase
MYLVEDLYKKQRERLGLELVAGKSGLRRPIRVPEAQRAGLPLSGYLKGYAWKRILIFGKVEIGYLRDLEPKLRLERLESILCFQTPAVIVARRYRPPKELTHLCESHGIPLFRTNMSTMNFLSKLTPLLTEEFAPNMNCHGTLVEVFGVGILLQGDSSVGKSEAALGLIERGHRLIADDIVFIKKRESNYVEGFGTELSRHHIEIRGIGIINAAYHYGVGCVEESKRVELVVHLENWDDQKFYDRVGLDEKTCDILGVKLPYHILPVKPGRDVVLLLETIASNYRLKNMGYNSAEEFKLKLLRKIAEKAKPGRHLETYT